MPRHLELMESCASCLPHGNSASSVDSIILPQMSFLSADVRQMLYRWNHLFEICFICKRSF